MKTIQWRLRKHFRRESKDEQWKLYSQVRDDEAATLVGNYNDNDRHFEYREEPAALAQRAKD